MEKMILVPDAPGYGQSDGNAALFTELDGGLGRGRLDKIGAAKTVNCTWTMNRSQYQYWRAFYYTVTKEGALPFLCDLLSDDGTGATEHTCQFIPGSVNLPSQQGLTYVQQATLQAKPLVHNAVVDNQIVLIFTESGGYPDEWYAALERLCNVTIPNAEAFNA